MSLQRFLRHGWKSFAPVACALGMVVNVLLAPPAFAERADREKPVTLEADKMSVDDLSKVQVYEGRVVLLQGTLSIRADKIVVKQDADGFRHGIATGKPGNLASFREKREGVDEYVEGWAERIEYDAKGDKAELFVQARLKRDLDEVRGNYISYDGKTEYFLVNSGGASASGSNPQGRVRAVIQPKKKEVSAAKMERGDLNLKPSPGIVNPRDD